MEGIFIIIGIIVFYNLFFKSDKKRNTYTNSNYSKPSYKPNSNVSNGNVKISDVNNKSKNITISEIKTPEKVVEVKPNFIPLTNIIFKASFDTGNYIYHYISDYYPVNRFPVSSIPQADLQNRYSLFNFKDGVNPELFAKYFASAFINKFGFDYLSDKILLIVPASTKHKTEIRFKVFCEKFCQYTNSINGYDMLKNSSIERGAQHQGGNSIGSANLEFNGEFKNKKFIVVDDVRTLGRSSNLVYQELKSRGASEVIFCYLGRTVPLQ